MPIQKEGPPFPPLIAAVIERSSSLAEYVRWKPKWHSNRRIIYRGQAVRSCQFTKKKNRARAFWCIITNSRLGSKEPQAAHLSSYPKISHSRHAILSIDPVNANTDSTRRVSRVIFRSWPAKSTNSEPDRHKAGNLALMSRARWSHDERMKPRVVGPPRLHRSLSVWAGQA